MTHPRHLQRMQIVHGTDALDGLDHGIVLDFSHLHDTGTNRFSIHDYRTSTALSLITSDLTTCQQQLLAQNLCQGVIRIHKQGTRQSIDYQSLFDHSNTSFW